MKKLINYWEKVTSCWKAGLSWLLEDALVSFYSFFTIIFAECAFLRYFFEKPIIVPFTLILIGYIVNVIVCAFFKGFWAGTKIELIFTIVYIATAITLFIIGISINVKLILRLTVIPLIITYIIVTIRDAPPPHTRFGHFMVKRLGQFIVVVSPWIIFTISILMLPSLSIIWKIIIPILYALFIPFISYIEDILCTEDIFELAIYH